MKHSVWALSHPSQDKSQAMTLFQTFHFLIALESNKLILLDSGTH